MDDHFWPLLYPALIVGALYGFSRGGVVDAGIAAIGALGGAVASFMALDGFGIDNAAVTFAGLVVSAWLAGRSHFSRPGKQLAGVDARQGPIPTLAYSN